MIIDTNMLYTDVTMSRPSSESLLVGAEAGRFSLVVPEVVIAEATKHYAARLRKALKEINLAIGRQQRELTRLGEPIPSLHELPTRESAEANYSELVQARLSRNGITVAASPPLMDAVDWYVRRRKPFKESGEGLADAVVWMTVLEYAKNANDVVLLTANLRDFGDGADPPGIAGALMEDLLSRGIPGDRVRLITDIASLVEEVTDPKAAALRILQATGPRDRLLEQLSAELAYKPVTVGPEGALPFHLEGAPQIVEANLRELISSDDPWFVEPDGLFLSVQAEGEFLLHAIVFKGDYYAAAETAAVTVSDWNWNRQYLAVEAYVSGRLDVNFIVEDDGSVKDVEIHDLEIDPVDRDQIELDSDPPEVNGELPP